MIPDACSEYFKVIASGCADLPVVVHLPHSSSNIPGWYRRKLLLSDEELANEQLRIVDWFTDELYAPLLQLGGKALVMGVSRLMTDPERFEEDAQECMSKVGMGVIYTATTLKGLLRIPPDFEEREQLLNLIYRPYHRQFTELVEACLAKHGRCLVLDCHSFPQRALPYEIEQTRERPEICIGTDNKHTPEWLLKIVQQACVQSGYHSAINTPFAGTIVPLKFYGDARVSSVMLEIKRSLYMDELTGQKTADFSRVVRFVETISQSLQGAGV